jgi:hypothetical protein
MALFDQDADIMLVGSDKGEVCRGRAAAETWVGGLLANNRFAWTMDQVDIDVHGETAWAFVDGKMAVSSAATGEQRSPRSVLARAVPVAHPAARAMTKPKRP